MVTSLPCRQAERKFDDAPQAKRHVAPSYAWNSAPSPASSAPPPRFGVWPGVEGATVPKDQAPAAILADSPIRRFYLLALSDTTKHPQIHGHPIICRRRG